jgi:hypothetical protein
MIPNKGERKMKKEMQWTMEIGFKRFEDGVGMATCRIEEREDGLQLCYNKHDVLIGAYHPKEEKYYEYV